MEGEPLPTAKLDEEQTFTLPWSSSASGGDRTFTLEAGSDVFFNPENQIFHSRRDGTARTITRLIEARVRQDPPEWEVELVVDPADGLDPPSVLISDGKIFLSDNGYNFSNEQFFMRACEVFRNRAFNPYGLVPPNGDYGGYICDFQTGTITYRSGDSIDYTRPNGPKKAIVKMLRPFAAETRNSEAIQLVAGRYEIIPGNYDGKTGDIENWRFDGYEAETLRQEHDRAFVDDAVLMHELEQGHAIILDVQDRKDSDHPIFLAEQAGEAKRESAPVSDAPKTPKRGLLGRLFGKS